MVDSENAATDVGAQGSRPVLRIDLERDLLPNSLKHETVLASISGQPKNMLRFLLGRWRELSIDSDMDFSTLPWRQDVLAFAKDAKAQGQAVVLTTRDDVDLARRAAAHLDVFDDVVGASKNVGGEAMPTRFSKPDSASRIKAAIRAIRPHQWVKNVLVFMPLMVSGDYSNILAWFYSGLAFVAFSLTASAIYVLNDLSDLEADRIHARKRFRPFASGTLPIVWGFWIAPSLLATGIATAVVASGLPYLVLYAVLSISYSLDLKKRTFFDVFALAALYTVRLFGGGEMSGHSPSVWLLGFSVFIFLGLALMKRMAELVGTKADKLKRRGYKQVDQPLLMSAGIASSFGAALVLALYLDSDEVRLVYAEPIRLWLIVPMMLFWQLKLWHKTLHGRMTDDPIVFAAKDRVSWIIGALTIVCAVLAHLSW